jgi:hypothetical protein
MFDLFEMGREFFEGLRAVDAAVVGRASKQPCRDCGGPLYRSDYPRKPRGGRLAGAAEVFNRRFSLCCGREGCRHRTTPPSVRFLGRRVYVGAVVIVASAIVLTTISANAAMRITGVPARTTRRWRRWWTGSFTASRPFVDLSARLVPAPSRQQLPVSLLERLAPEGAASVSELLTWLAPLTTTSCPEGSRWARAVM